MDIRGQYGRRQTKMVCGGFFVSINNKKCQITIKFLEKYPIKRLTETKKSFDGEAGGSPDVSFTYKSHIDASKF